MFTDLTFSVDVQDGKVTLADEPGYRRQIRQFKNGKATLRLEVDRGKRSNQANRYYRLILGLISDDTGYEVDELHEMFKRRFLTPRIVDVMGEQIAIYTTTQEDSAGFREYVDRIRRFALTERGIETPDPDPALRGHSRHAKRQEAA